jgi:hypothetical protein
MNRMRQNDSQALFRVMIESVGPESSFFQIFWSPATYPGEAIESVLSACAQLGVTRAIARELDYLEFDASAENVVYDKKLNVFYGVERYSFPTESAFTAPTGIIWTGQKGEYDYDLIQEGFSFWKTDEGIYELEVAIEKDKLFDSFISLMNVLPSIEVFWIRLAGDWENESREELWTNEKLNTVAAITSYLTDRSADTIANGHVALTTYSNAGQTNLYIDTHKTIKVLTKSATIQRQMADSLKSSGFNELSEFHSLEYCYYHWHFRPAQSKSRKKFIRMLKQDGFRLWKEQAVEAET